MSKFKYRKYKKKDKGYRGKLKVVTCPYLDSYVEMPVFCLADPRCKCYVKGKCTYKKEEVDESGRDGQGTG